MSKTKPTLGLIASVRHRYSITRWRQECAERGAALTVFDPDSSSMFVDSSGVQLLVDGKPFDSPVQGVHRIRTSKTAAMIENYFIGRGARNFRLQPTSVVRGSGSKFSMYAAMALAGVPVPRSFYIDSKSAVHDCIAYFENDFPVIVKVENAAVSHHGIGVMRADSPASLRAIVGCFLELKHPLTVQEFVSEHAGMDYRAVVLDGEVIASASRDNRHNDDFRSNLYQGGMASSVELTDVQRQAAILATRSCNIIFAGVDLLGSPDHPVVTEVNGPCDYQYVEETTGANVVGALADFLLRA